MVGISQREFNTWNVRCTKCNEGKPKEEFIHSYARVCKACRAEKKKETGSNDSTIWEHFKR